jgi:two-component system, OmpR family, sensor kinase
MSSGGSAQHRPGWLHRWLAGRTLRARLICGLVALLFVACATVGVVTYESLHGSLLRQLDSELVAASQRYTACVDGPPPGQPNPADPDDPPGDPADNNVANPMACADTPGQAQSTFSAAIAAGTLTAKVTHGTCNLTAADDATLRALPVNGRPYTGELYSLGGDYRLLAVRGADGTTLITGLPMAPVTDTLDNVELTEIIVFAAALVLTAFIGTGWVRLSLRPLRRMTATASEVARLPLASEVDVPHRVADADQRTEVGQLGAAFNRMLGHVESALARRQHSEARLRQFAADASHELRTPLAAIRGYAELARRHPGTLPPEVARALARVEAESARMSSLVDDLLLLARLDAGRPLEVQPVDLTRLAIDAASDARAAAPDHRWRLELPEGSVLVPGDEYRLHQVLANLLSNARAHTPPGTTVTVALGSSPELQVAELSVTDDGPGIPKGLQPDLFERFVRGDESRSRAAGSTGLGLSIVAAVVAAHRGTVAVDSEPGRTRFTITLPLLPGQDRTPEPADPQQPMDVLDPEVR